MSMAKIPLVDRSNYYRGLLVLIGKDRVIDERERSLMLRLGRMLDFDSRFCEAAIENLLDNKYINDEPLVFGNREIAECFLRDAIRLAFADEKIHAHELAWLRTIAQANKVKEEWLDEEVQYFQKKMHSLDQSAPFSIQQYV
jgi:hypothetical protein